TGRIEPLAKQRQDAPARPRNERAVLERPARVAYRLAGIDGFQPSEVLEAGGRAEFGPWTRALPRAGVGGRLQVASHPGRGCVPAGRAEAAEHAPFRRLLIYMEKLRIVFPGEGLDRFRHEGMRADLDCLADTKEFVERHCAASRV